jgi:nickel-type superoxide dismutase maturation protease
VGELRNRETANQRQTIADNQARPKGRAFLQMIPDATIIDHLYILLGWRANIRIEGPSMLPVLAHGDRVVVDPSAIPAKGDIVVAYHPYKKNVSIVKRIVDILPDGRYVLLGENLDESTDSRQFGTIAGKDIFGKVVARIP